MGHYKLIDQSPQSINHPSKPEQSPGFLDAPGRLQTQEHAKASRISHID